MSRARTHIPQLFLASLALVVLAACSSDPEDHIVDFIPGRPQVPTIDPELNPPDGARQYPTSATIVWAKLNPSHDSLEYDLYLGADTALQVVATGLTTPTYVMPALRPGTRYFWRVVVRDTAGEEDTSNTWSFQTWVYAPYPLVQGAVWEYGTEFREFNYRGPGGFSRRLDTSRYVMRHEVIGPEELSPGTWVQRVNSREQHVHPDSSLDSSVYYAANRESGYYHIQGKVAPRLITGNASGNTDRLYHFRGRTFGSPQEIFQWVERRVASLNATPADDTLLGQHPDLAYPLIIGQEWVSYELYGTPAARKSVIRDTNLVMPWGAERCHVVLTEFDLDEDGTADSDMVRIEYVSARGILMSLAIARDILVTGYSDPYGEANGLVDFIEESIATQATIPALP